MADVKITKQSEEPLLKRKAVMFEVSHGASPTPKRKETKSKLAVLAGADESLVVIDGFVTEYGLNKTLGKAFVYKDAASLAVAEGKKKVQKEKEGKAKKGAPAPAPSA
jgi:small subunit ribosomal protein S24e